MIIIVPIEELLSQNTTEISLFANQLIYELVQKKPTAPLTLIVLASSWQKPLPENVFQFLSILAERIRHKAIANTGLVIDLEFQGISLTLADFNKLSADLPAFRFCNVDDKTALELKKNMPVELAAKLQQILIRLKQTPLTKNQAASAPQENAETILTADINAQPIYKNAEDHLIIANLRIDKFYEDVLRFLRNNISTQKHVIFSPMGLALLTTEQLTAFLDFLRTSSAASITLDSAEGAEILNKAKALPNLLSSFTALRDSKPLIFTTGDKYFRVDQLTNENWVHEALSARDQFAYEVLKRYKMQGEIVLPLSYVTAISNENDLAVAVQQLMHHVGAYCAEENKRGLVDANNQKLAIVIDNDGKLEQTPAQLVHVINSVAASVQNINRKTTLDLQNIFVSAAELKETKRNIAQFNDLILNQNSFDDILRHNSFSLIDNLCGLERLIIQNDLGQQVIPRQEIRSYLSASALHYENESSVVFKNRDLSKDDNLQNVHAKIKNQPLVSLLQCRLHRIPEDRLEKLLDSFTQSNSQYFYFSAEEFNKIQASGSAKIHASLDVLIQNKTVTLIDKTEAQTDARHNEDQLNRSDTYPNLKKQKKAQLLDIPALAAKVEETIAAFEKSKAYRFYQFSGIDIANKGKKVELLKNALATAKQAPATTVNEFLNSGGEEKSLRAALSFSRYSLFAKTGNTKSLQAIEAKVAEFKI